MIRLGIINDVHLTLRSPKGRVETDEEFALAQKRKLEWAAQTWVEHGVDAVLNGGDFFDVPYPPYGLVQWALDWLRDLKVPFFSCLGQHETKTFTEDRLFRLPHYLIEKETELVEFLDPRTLPIFSDGFSVYRASWQQPIPEPIGTRPRILITHRTVLEKPFAKGQAWESVEEFMNGPAAAYDIVVCGDVHKPLIQQLGRRHYIDIGSLCRMRVSETHQPQIGILEFDPDHQLPDAELPPEATLTALPLPESIAHPASEIFTRGHIERVQAKKRLLERFTEAVKTTRGEGLAAAAFLNRQLQDTQLRPGARVLAAKFLADAQEEINVGHG